MSEVLPSYVQKYLRPNTSSAPKVISMKQKISSVEERKLRRFYKCTLFNLRTNVKSEQCFATKNSSESFRVHLFTKHKTIKQFYCCYCYPKLNDCDNKDKVYMDVEGLVKHMIDCHQHRRYQCNLCLYRSISAENVSIHQSVIHRDIYRSKTQLRGKCCKVLVCPPVSKDSVSKKVPTALQLFNNYSYRRLNQNKNYQCLYCNYMNKNLSFVVQHCVQTHPDYHILYYNPEPIVTSTHSPDNIRQQLYSDIDLFSKPTAAETQDNRVTSTETSTALKEYVEECSIKNKKQRVAHRQSDYPTLSSMSNKVLNKKPNHYMNNRKKYISCLSKEPFYKLGSPHPRTQTTSSMGSTRLNILATIKKNKLNANKYNSSKHKISSNQFYSNKLHSNKINSNNIRKGVPLSKNIPKPKKQYESDDSDELTPSKRKINYLTEEEYEELNELSYSQPNINKTTQKKQSSTETKSKERVRTSSISESPLKRSSSNNMTSIPSLNNNSNDTLNKPSTSRMTTTLEKVLPEDEEEKEDEEVVEREEEPDLIEISDQNYVCLFCDDTFEKRSLAKEHLGTHLPEVNECIYDYHITKPINTWFKIFIEKQGEEFYDGISEDSEHYFKCPICVRIGRIRHLKPRSYRTFWELRSHFWEHTFWKPIQCLLCKSNQELPNCDYLIAKHMNSFHSEQLCDSNDYAINQILGNKAKNQFTTKQKNALKDNEFIETFCFEPLDNKILAILKQISDRRESYLRKDSGQMYDKPIIMPTLCIKRLPPLNFDNNEMVKSYVQQYEKNERLKRKKKSGSTVAQPKQPLDTILLGSSSDEDLIENSPKTPKRNLFEESDDEPIAQNNSPLNGSDRDQNQISDNQLDVSNVRRYKCHYCIEEFENKKEIIEHVKTLHPEQIIRFERI